MAAASEELHRIAMALKAAGRGDLRLQMLRGMKAGAAPLVHAVKQAALEKLPKSGGLNQQVAGQKVTVSVLTSARNAGVRMRTTAPDTAQTDSGFVRHPTFGRRGKGDWKTQEIPQAAGWWSQTLAEAAPAVTPALVAVMRRVSVEITEGA